MPNIKPISELRNYTDSSQAGRYVKACISYDEMVMVNMDTYNG